MLLEGSVVPPPPIGDVRGVSLEWTLALPLVGASGLITGGLVLPIEGLALTDEGVSLAVEEPVTPVHEVHSVVEDMTAIVLGLVALSLPVLSLGGGLWVTGSEADGVPPPSVVSGCGG